MFEMIMVVCGIAYGAERCEVAEFGPFDDEAICTMAKPLVGSIFEQELTKNGVTGVRMIAACRKKDRLV